MRPEAQRDRWDHGNRLERGPGRLAMGPYPTARIAHDYGSVARFDTPVSVASTAMPSMMVRPVLPQHYAPNPVAWNEGYRNMHRAEPMDQPPLPVPPPVPRERGTYQRPTHRTDASSSHAHQQHSALAYPDHLDVDRDRANPRSLTQRASYTRKHDHPPPEEYDRPYGANKKPKLEPARRWPEQSSAPAPSSAPAGKGTYTRAQRPTQPKPASPAPAKSRRDRSASLDSVGRIRRKRSPSVSSSDDSRGAYRRHRNRTRSPTPPARQRQAQGQYKRAQPPSVQRSNDRSDRNGSSRQRDGGWSTSARGRSPASARTRSPAKRRSASLSPDRSARSSRRGDSPRRRSRSRSPVAAKRPRTPSRERYYDSARPDVRPQRDDRLSDGRRDDHAEPWPRKPPAASAPSRHENEAPASTIASGFKRISGKPPSVPADLLRKFFPRDGDDEPRTAHPLPPKPGFLRTAPPPSTPSVPLYETPQTPTAAPLPPPPIREPVMGPPATLPARTGNLNLPPRPTVPEAESAPNGRSHAPQVRNDAPSTPQPPSRPETPHNGTPSQVPTEPSTPTPATLVQQAVNPPKPVLQTKEIYERLAQVGEGTYGKVYKARNIEDGTIVALKRIRMEAERDGFPITSVREIKLLQSLRHPNVVSLTEMMVSHGSVYMVFEYLDHDLTGVLRCPHITFKPAHLKSIMHQLLVGLDYIHGRGILHRDLKGSNILLSKMGQVKIADFGLARFYARAQGNDYTNRVITQWYKPPELLYGATVYNEEVDVWSAGCIFLELFTRRPVFQGQDEIHQLDVIFKVLGTPEAETSPGLLQLPWYELVKPKATIKSTLRDSFGPKYLKSTAAVELAERLLALDPERRISAIDAIALPYFTTEDPPAEQPTMLQDVQGDWHELEAKALTSRARKGHGVKAEPPKQGR